jgi:hypothetical protein
MEPAKGIHPPTYGLQKQWRGEPRFFRPLLGAETGGEAGRRWASLLVADHPGSVREWINTAPSGSILSVHSRQL